MYIDFDALEAVFLLVICLPAIVIGFGSLWESLTTRGRKQPGLEMLDVFDALPLIGVFGFFALWILESRRP